MNNIALMTDIEILKMIAERAKVSRIHHNLRQIDLHKKSGVPLSSIRVFERTGTISFSHLVKISRVLEEIEILGTLFAEKTPLDIEIMAKEHSKKRQRVRK